MQKNDGQLTRTEKEYGVDKSIITAILLVETGLGASVGTRSTLNTLSTIASLMDPSVREMFWDLIPDSKKISRKKFEKRAASRSKWAYKELKAFLEYTSREGFDPTSIPGSFAGAVGVAQFMPTSIMAYGKDGDNDGMEEGPNSLRPLSFAEAVHFAGHDPKRLTDVSLAEGDQLLLTVEGDDFVGIDWRIRYTTPVPDLDLQDEQLRSEVGLAKNESELETANIRVTVGDLTQNVSVEWPSNHQAEPVTFRYDVLPTFTR